MLRDVGRGASHSAMGGGGGRALVRLPRSDVELALGGGVEVCQVEDAGRTFQALGTVCATAGNGRILGFREWQVILGVWRRKRCQRPPWGGGLGPNWEGLECQPKELRLKECPGDSGSEMGDKMKAPCGRGFPFGLQPSAFRKMFLGAQGSTLLVSRPLLVPPEAASLWFSLAAP